jgi:hypothetical protein
MDWTVGNILAAGGTPTGAGQVGGMVWQSVLLMGAAAALVALGWAVLRHNRARRAGQQEPPALGFSLDELRRLHRQGLLTDEEFAKVKARLIVALEAKGGAAAGDTTLPGDQGAGEDLAGPPRG